MAEEKRDKAKPSGKQEERDIEENGGMFLEKEDIRLIYNALKQYKPKPDEDNLHYALLEQFEEILAVDFAEISYKEGLNKRSVPPSLRRDPGSSLHEFSQGIGKSIKMIGGRGAKPDQGTPPGTPPWPSRGRKGQRLRR